MELLLLVIFFAIIFDFINGFHDTANAIATVVATRVLSPGMAVLMAAGLNILGALSGTSVAKTIGSGIVGTNVSQEVVIAALLGAIIWNLITWYWGIPSSSSHALIGGLVGSGIAAQGLNQVHWGILRDKVGIPLFTSPVAGFFIGILVMKVILFVCGRWSPGRVQSFFKKSQLISSAFMAFSHGSNDAQKTMGIITLALIASGYLSASPFVVPTWVILVSALAMGIGTASGGWKIIHTMGNKLTQLTPVQGFAAETAAAGIIEAGSFFGFPLSTTHVISTTIMGVGASKNLRSVRWYVARRIIHAWILTIPVCSLLSWMAYHIVVTLV